jgi:hypothetical protein
MDPWHSPLFLIFLGVLIVLQSLAEGVLFNAGRVGGKDALRFTNALSS